MQMNALQEITNVVQTYSRFNSSEYGLKAGDIVASCRDPGRRYGEFSFGFVSIPGKTSARIQQFQQHLTKGKSIDRLWLAFIDNLGKSEGAAAWNSSWVRLS